MDRLLKRFSAVEARRAWAIALGPNSWQARLNPAAGQLSLNAIVAADTAPMATRSPFRPPRRHGVHRGHLCRNQTSARLSRSTCRSSGLNQSLNRDRRHAPAVQVMFAR